MHNVLVWIDAHPLRFAGGFICMLLIIDYALLRAEVFKYESIIRSLQLDLASLRWRLRHGIKVD